MAARILTAYCLLPTSYISRQKLLHNQILITIFAPSITRERAVWNTTPSSHWSCTAKPSCTSPPAHSRFGHMLDFCLLRIVTSTQSRRYTFGVRIIKRLKKLSSQQLCHSVFFRIFAMNTKIYCTQGCALHRVLLYFYTLSCFCFYIVCCDGRGYPPRLVPTRRLLPFPVPVRQSAL